MNVGEDFKILICMKGFQKNQWLHRFEGILCMKGFHKKTYKYTDLRKLNV